MGVARRGCSLLALVTIAGCGATAVTPRVAAPRGPSLARWTPLVHIHRPLDLALRGPGGPVVMEAAGRLWSITSSGIVTRLDPRYTSPGGEEPYIAVPRPGRPGCSFGSSSVYAIRLTRGRGVTRISGNGAGRRFADVTAPGLIDGITFDEIGTFGYRLLVTINHGATSTVDAIDCHGAVATITQTAPRVEGGIEVAPMTFGRFAGDLIAPDEKGGRVFAITPGGRSALVANSGLPHGNDVGVESEGFVPERPRFEALVADRLTPGNRHPGDDVLLGLSSAALRAAGVRPFDLLVTTEGGALTDAIRCSADGCQVHRVAEGPAIAHVEGHIVFR